MDVGHLLKLMFDVSMTDPKWYNWSNCLRSNANTANLLGEIWKWIDYTNIKIQQEVNSITQSLVVGIVNVVLLASATFFSFFK